MKQKNTKIYLSPPNINNKEIEDVVSAMKSGWISPFGSFTDSFSKKLSDYFDKKILLTNSGTSAIHLALKACNIKEGDYVLCSDFTFAATAFPILYQKAIPIFIGSDTKTWNLSHESLSEAISKLKKQNIYPKAIIIAHIYGMPAEMDKILEICNNNGIIIIEDAAEAFGSRYNNIPLGNLGEYGILSFNGNKIITCSMGGALITNNSEGHFYAKKLATQAKEEGFDYYIHKELGYNYLQSNILAAIGNSQFDKLERKIKKRRKIFNYYLSFFKKYIEVEYQIENEVSFSNRWLSCFIFPEKLNSKIKEILTQNNIESRYLWTPLHTQNIFKKFLFFGDNKLEKKLFNQGLSLPSGGNLNKKDLERITSILKKTFK